MQLNSSGRVSFAGSACPSPVFDNGRQFDNKKMRDLCKELVIRKDFSTRHHLQANGQVEVANKTIKHTLKRKLDASKGAWVDELPHVLWPIRTTSQTTIGETPFSMTYRAEAMSPIEIYFNEINNDEAQVCKLHLLEERKDSSQVKLAMYQRNMTRYYNSKVRNQTLRLGDLVLRRVFFIIKANKLQSVQTELGSIHRVIEVQSQTIQHKLPARPPREPQQLPRQPCLVGFQVVHQTLLPMKLSPELGGPPLGDPTWLGHSMRSRNW
ncbi:uncharacterized protein LOC111370748 [Olea europaea var. sylvestris]|uniref:uncharacterized protein LOC111370748 n=1 Tax=Olea europaea var. sylvestris TaxID=158386 RepID=UPI000C1D4350|nr:uncharacterized protein LOC111370748 [Olea europaea var. sylvestris]